MTTRSGKRFKPRWWALHDSSWSEASVVIQQILHGYLSPAEFAAARPVCKAWRTAFRSRARHLRLLAAPTTISTARGLRQTVAAGFEDCSSLHVVLPSVMLPARPTPEDIATSVEAIYVDALPNMEVLQKQAAAKARAIAVAAALLHSKSGRPLLHLELDVTTNAPYSGLPTLFTPQLAQLQSLDLTGCYHQSSVLLVIAQHLQQLRELVLNGPNFTTLSGRPQCKVAKCAHRYGGYTIYEPQHLVALAQLPNLQLLEVSLPPSAFRDPGGERKIASVAAIAQLTRLSALHITDPNLPVDAVHLLSTLVHLTHLNCAAGIGDRSSNSTVLRLQQVQQWSKALPALKQLQQLHVVNPELCDELLQALAGSSSRSLQHLTLQSVEKAFFPPVTAAGAQAVTHIASVVVVHSTLSGLRCDQHQHLLQLPNVQVQVVNSVIQCGTFSGRENVSDDEQPGPWRRAACKCLTCVAERHLRMLQQQ